MSVERKDQAADLRVDSPGVERSNERVDGLDFWLPSRMLAKEEHPTTLKTIFFLIVR